MRSPGPYDMRYDEFVLCPQCGQTFQLLDWHCARHVLSCGPTVAVPPARLREIIATAATHGVTVVAQ